VRSKSTDGWTESACVSTLRFALGLRFEGLQTVATTLRIGITREMGRLLRLFGAGSPFVSGAPQGDKKSLGLPRFDSSSQSFAGNHRNQQ
jgi:hypothetical protein